MRGVGFIVVASLVLGTAGIAACGRNTPPSPNVRPGESGETPPAVPFEVRRESSDLTFFWFDDRGAPHAVTRVEDVPEANRGRVRVDPPTPEQRAAGWVYVADLRAPGADGRYAVRPVQSETFASELGQLNGLAAVAPRDPSPPRTAAGSVAQNGAARVVLYGASWCGACHQAAEYLRANNIPFVEHDIEREPNAQRELYSRAAEQGVPTSSIPIIAVDGRLMVGFNPEAIQRALRRNG